MDLKGEEIIAQPMQRVWDCLNDPEILKACLPGCEEITKTGDDEFKVVLTAAVGPVKARFTGKLMLSDLNPPESYSLNFEGAGGAAGFAKGQAKVHLTPDDAGTKLAYEANAKIGGKIAQVGSRLIDGVARRIVADFFARFNERVATPESAEPSRSAAPDELHQSRESVDTVQITAPEGRSGKSRTAIWVGVAIIVVAALYLLSR